MLKIRKLFAALGSDERGLTAVEYAVLGAIVVAAIIGVGNSFKTDLKTAFSGILSSATATT